MLSHVIDRLSHRISCDEATSAFTLHYSLVHCAYSFLNMLSEGSIVLLSRHDASRATRLESFTSIGLSPTRCSVLSLDTPYVPARIISRNKNEKSSFLFDGNFADIFNNYIKTNNICEFYLFDKQGSYLFLDQQANPSWLFIRNETGIKNSIQRAAQYGAPQSILDRLKNNEILSLYEEEDFKKRSNINWEEYLLPATIFESNNQYSKSFPNANTKSTSATKYYYTFTKKFPEHGIDKDKILSYEEFLQNS